MKELGEFSELSIGLVLLDMENEGKEVRVSNLTTNSVEMALIKDERWYDVEVECEKCGKKNRIINADRNKKIACTGSINIEKEGKQFNVTCGNKNYKELKKEYIGVDCYQWFQYEKWFKERFKKQ